MIPTPEQQQRADEVWNRLVGLFGGDTVRRKYGSEMPVEWRGVIMKLNVVELERGMRRLVHSGRDQVPTLPAFVRLCRSIGSEDINEGPGQNSQAPRLPSTPPQTLRDRWTALGNRHLFAQVARRICLRQPPYTDEQMEILKDARDNWVDDMVDLASNIENGEVPVDVQKSCWKDYIGGADQRIAAMRSQQAAA